MNLQARKSVCKIGASFLKKLRNVRRSNWTKSDRSRNFFRSSPLSLVAENISTRSVPKIFCCLTAGSSFLLLEWKAEGYKAACVCYEASRYSRDTQNSKGPNLIRRKRHLTHTQYFSRESTIAPQLGPGWKLKEVEEVGITSQGTQHRCLQKRKNGIAYKDYMSTSY